MRPTQHDPDDARQLAAARRPKHRRDLADRVERQADDDSTSVAGEEDPGSADEELREPPGRDVRR